MTSKSLPSAYASVSVMSGSSSTISRLGLALSGMAPAIRIGYAPEKGVFQSALPVALEQPRRRAVVGQPPLVQHRHMVADFLDVREGMRRQKYRSALRFTLQERALDVRACPRIEP